ncbi:MAG: protein arginine kinase [Candidatus Krumholzibacteriota bacterium]|nr:protein arginine kinase [Candidatus Krumholzibacteriota bacterium]
MSVIDELLSVPADWLRGDGEENEMVLSCRVRLARNLERKPFTHISGAEDLRDIQGEIKEAVAGTAAMGEALVIDMDDILETERMLLAERRLLSQEMVQKYQNRSLLVNRGEGVSVMVNEADHLRMQVLESGLSARDAFRIISALDDELDEHLGFAFSDRLGYLTACTTNVGTGLRVSAMVHLPGLVHNNDIRQVIDGLRHVKLTVRGSYGEGSEVMGNFFQISNSITLGHTEADTVEDMESHLKKVLEFEKKARESLLREARSLLEDKIWRSYGILKSARLVSPKEAMGLISAVRLGIGLGIVTDVALTDLNEILIMIQPMHLQRLHDRAMKPEERDRIRADFIRSKLNKQ